MEHPLVSTNDMRDTPALTALTSPLLALLAKPITYLDRSDVFVPRRRDIVTLTSLRVCGGSEGGGATIGAKLEQLRN